MRIRVLLIILILLVSGCKDDSNSDSSVASNAENTATSTTNNRAYPMTQPDTSTVPATPATISGLPHIVGKNRIAIRNVSLKFLKQRGESNIAIAAIMGQAAAETGDFVYMHEIGSPEYLQYLEGRKDLGNIYPGDGPRFKGRGFIHLTGRNNYRIYGNKAHVDLINNPNLAERADYAIVLMHHYLLSRRHGDTGYGHARKGNIRGLTKHINGGRNGYARRIRYYQKYLAELNAGKFNNVFGMRTPQTPSTKYFQRQRRR